MKVAKDKSSPASHKALKISAKARYALRILMDVARHQDDDEPRTEAVISRCQGISMKFLSRIVVPLRRAGLLASTRGATGGFRLVKKPKKITLLEIVEVMQGPVAVLDCLAEPSTCDRRADCASRRIWGRVNASLRKSLASITLADAL